MFSGNGTPSLLGSRYQRRIHCCVMTLTTPVRPHAETHFTGSEFVRDIVIGMSDGLTVPFALAAGLSGAVESSSIILGKSPRSRTSCAPMGWTKTMPPGLCSPSSPTRNAGSTS